MHEERGVVVEFLESPLDRGLRASGPGEFQPRADVIAAGEADCTLLTGTLRLDGDAVADPELFCDVVADCGDFPCGFVAEHERLADDENAVSAVAVVVHVCSADSGGSDSDLDFVWGRRGGGLRFDAHVVRAVKHGGKMGGCHFGSRVGYVRQTIRLTCCYDPATGGRSICALEHHRTGYIPFTNGLCYSGKTFLASRISVQLIYAFT